MTVDGSRDGVLCVGRLYCDLVFTGVPRLPSMGTEVFASGVALHAGGGAFITSAYLRALGRPAFLAAILPGAPFDGIVTHQIEAAGVNSGLCRRASPGSEPQLTVVLVGAADRAFVTHRTGAALPPLSDGDIRGRGIRHLHIGELRSLVEQPDLLDFARSNDLSLSLDCGWDDSVTADVAGLIAQVDVFLPNQAEADRLGAMGVPHSLAPLTVVKCGRDGAWATAGGKCLAGPTRPVDMVDTTGAGDAFNGGFLNRWLDGAPLEDCLAAGNACGAAAVRIRGGFNPSILTDADFSLFRETELMN